MSKRVSFDRPERFKNSVATYSAPVQRAGNLA
jgi:hypothetical protein